jgi:hypothetical protein
MSKVGKSERPEVRKTSPQNEMILQYTEKFFRTSGLPDFRSLFQHFHYFVNSLVNLRVTAIDPVFKSIDD